MFVMEMILLAGGFGTRLKTVVKDMPKPMAEVAGKPFLAHVLDWAKQQSVTHVVLAVSYKWETIKTYFESDYQGVELTYSAESDPLGTGGGMRLAIEHTSARDIFACNADTLFTVDLQAMKALHESGGYTLTLAAKKVADSSRYGFLRLDGTKIIGFSEKNETAEGLINGGVYLFNRDLLKAWDMNAKFSFERDVIINCANMGAYVSDEYFIDIGVPQDYEKAQRDFK